MIVAVEHFLAFHAVIPSHLKPGYWSVEQDDELRSKGLAACAHIREVEEPRPGDEHSST